MDYQKYTNASQFKRNAKILKVGIQNIINGGDVQRKNVVNNVDKSSLWAP